MFDSLHEPAEMLDEMGRFRWGNGEAAQDRIR